MTKKIDFKSEAGRLHLFAQVLQTDPRSVKDKLTLEQLETYIDAELAGEDAMNQFPEVAVLLDASPEYADIYKRFYDLKLLESKDILPEPESVPVFDLSFIKPSPKFDWTEAFKDLGNHLFLQFSEALLNLLNPSLALAVKATSESEEKVLYRLGTSDETNESDLKNIPIQFTITEDVNNPELCSIEITVTPPGRDFPDLAEIVVRLRWGEEKQEEETDDFGQVIFEGIPIEQLPHLRLEVDLV